MVSYKNGDLFSSGCNVICHQVNCKGMMNAGIAKTMRKKYPDVYKVFIASFCEKNNKLGNIDVVYIQQDHRFVMNMYAQFNYRPVGVVHTDYDAFRSCLKGIKTEINDYISAHGSFGENGFKIGFPDHIGCGLAGGDWEVVKAIIEDEFSADEWNVEIWKL